MDHQAGADVAEDPTGQKRESRVNADGGRRSTGGGGQRDDTEVGPGDRDGLPVDRFTASSVDPVGVVEFLPPSVPGRHRGAIRS